MTTKAERDLDEELGASPWPMYADEEEPWKDPERMLKLDDKFAYQYEIAHVLGTTPSTISYWMDKAKNEYVPEPDDEEMTCKFYDVCHNEIPHPHHDLCTTCLDLLRHDQSGEGDNLREDFKEEDDREEFIAELHDNYDYEDDN